MRRPARTCHPRGAGATPSTRRRDRRSDLEAHPAALRRDEQHRFAHLATYAHRTRLTVGSQSDRSVSPEQSPTGCSDACELPHHGAGSTRGSRAHRSWAWCGKLSQCGGSERSAMKIRPATRDDLQPIVAVKVDAIRPVYEATHSDTLAS